jgi:hypothetical protein
MAGVLLALGVYILARFSGSRRGCWERPSAD